MIKIAVAGAGAIGSTVCRALIDGIDGFELVAVTDLNPEKAAASIDRPGFGLNFVPFDRIAETADWIVEALPAAEVPKLAAMVLPEGKILVAISSSALLLYPDITKHGKGRILVPSGAIAGVDGIAALAEQGLDLLKIKTTKKPSSYSNAPYIINNQIDLSTVTTPTRIFAGHALEAAEAFPANVNVAATLALASRLDPRQVQVEAWADPAVRNNTHEISAENSQSRLNFKIENIPSPDNPKSSALTALSVIALLRRQTAPLSIP